jgi:ABC-type lipopolysaccharide export system ATPase subunit
VGLLKEIAIEQVAAKVGLFGSQGSGKSLTAFLLAIGLSKAFHNGAPIAIHDTEGASDFLEPIARAEGVKVLRHKSTSFRDMVTVLGEAERGGCCVFIQDTVSRPWTELVEAIQKKRNVKRLEFQHWNEVKTTWREQFVDRYMVSPLPLLGRRPGR